MIALTDRRPFVLGILTGATLVFAGCEAAPTVEESESLSAGAYLMGATGIAEHENGTVYVAPIGLRSEAGPQDGGSWVILDLSFDGPEETVRAIAQALKYRFFYDAPSFITIRNPQGRAVRLDKPRYEDRQDTSWVQFDPGILYQKAVGGRFQALQPYPIALRKRPQAGTYEVRLHSDALAEALASINSKYADVKVDGSAHAFELLRAEIQSE